MKASGQYVLCAVIAGTVVGLIFLALDLALT
jgi:hypothetical protein